MLPDERGPGPLLKQRGVKLNAAAPNLVKVAVRLRPGKQGEGRDCVTVDPSVPNTLRCEDPIEKIPGLGMGFNRSGGFTLDHAYGPSAPTSEIYQDTVQRLVKSVVREGVNACCFAYGATGSGKTYTMEGTSTSPGVMQLAIRDLFDWLETGATVTASYFQIYNESCTDLLTAAAKADEPTELHVRMDADGRTQVVGLRQVVVATTDELLALVAEGSARRCTSGTAVNETSSRSHAILQISLEQPKRALTSKLSLIDLAGSERATRANTTGQAFTEAKNINHSLLALSKCIRARVEGTKANYRESKLTRLLEDSLTGGATTTMVCACSPAAAVFDETLQTLQRAHEVKQIKRPLAPAPPVKAYLAPTRAASVPRGAEAAAAADAPSAVVGGGGAGSARASLVPPLRGLRRASHEPFHGSAAVAFGSSRNSSPRTSTRGLEAKPGLEISALGLEADALQHPREAELLALLARVRQCDDAKVAIFLRASSALLDGLDESYARLDSRDHGVHAAPPVVRKTASPSPVGSPLSENAPALLPVSTRGLLASRRDQQQHAMMLEAAAVGGRPSVPSRASAVGATAPSGKPLVLRSSTSAASVGGDKVPVPPANTSRPTTPPLHRLVRPSSVPSSRVPTPPLIRAPMSRVSSAGSSRASSHPPSRSTSPHQPKRGATACSSAASGCVSACIPSADGTSVYREVGYRSPPAGDQVDADAAEVLS